MCEGLTSVGVWFSFLQFDLNHILFQFQFLTKLLTYSLTKTNFTPIWHLPSLDYKLYIHLFKKKTGVFKNQKVTATAGRLSLCFLWANHLLACSIKQVYFIPHSYLKIDTHRNLLISICTQGKNAVLMQVTNLPTRTTGLHPVVCPPCELFWPVREITGWRRSPHVGSFYIWTEDSHKPKANIWPVYSTRLCTKRLHIPTFRSFGSHYGTLTSTSMFHITGWCLLIELCYTVTPTRRRWRRPTLLI